jgi:serine phosphatase RsbU (regulator of sigma subunit)
MPTRHSDIGIDEYLRNRLMPVEGSIPNLPGIEMYGNSIPAGTIGGDLFEYINFQQRYDIDARIQRASSLSKEYLDLLPDGAPPRNSVDYHVHWLKSRPDYKPKLELEYREAQSSEQVRIAEDLRRLNDTAGVLVVDAQGHGIISAKIASTVHDTFHALMLSELNHHGKTTPELFEMLNLRLARSVTARNALGINEGASAREMATMLYGEVHPYGCFRFVNFGHPHPLIFSAERRQFIEIEKGQMAQFLALGLEVPEDYPDRTRYLSMHYRRAGANDSNIAEITLTNPGDALFIYTDGVYDGSDNEDRRDLEAIVRKHSHLPAKAICNALLEHAKAKDELLRQLGEEDRIDDKTVFIIKRS